MKLTKGFSGVQVSYHLKINKPIIRKTSI